MPSIADRSGLAISIRAAQHERLFRVKAAPRPIQPRPEIAVVAGNSPRLPGRVRPHMCCMWPSVPLAESWVHKGCPLSCPANHSGPKGREQPGPVNDASVEWLQAARGAFGRTAAEGPESAGDATVGGVHHHRAPDKGSAGQITGNVAIAPQRLSACAAMGIAVGGRAADTKAGQSVDRGGHRFSRRQARRSAGNGTGVGVPFASAETEPERCAHNRSPRGDRGEGRLKALLSRIRR